MAKLTKVQAEVVRAMQGGKILVLCRMTGEFLLGSGPNRRVRRPTCKALARMGLIQGTENRIWVDYGLTDKGREYGG